MSADKNTAIIRRYFEEVRTKGELGVIDEIFADEFIRHTLRGTQTGTPESQKHTITQWRTAFPDYRDTILALVAEGDRVAAHVLFSGTHTGVFEYGELGPWAPTGRSMQCWEFFVYRLADGKIVEQSALWDKLSFQEQLGHGAAAVAPTA
jgi:predicted ester cyclase